MKGNIKESEYFLKKLDSEKKRIDKFEDALKKIDKSNVQGIRIGKIHLANLYLNCVKVAYSIDKTFEGMYPYYIKFLEYYKDVCTSDDSMYDIIDIFSIGVLLHKRKNEFIDYLEKIFLDYNPNDGLVIFLMDYLQRKTFNKTVSKIDYFNKLIENEDKLKILKEELELWYNQHNDAYWYNTHEAKNNTYCGYWCFEIAALVQILGLDDRSLRENQYYPQDISE